MLSRVSWVFTFLLGLLPYISTTKQPPIPSFWAEWTTAVLASCWLISVGRDLKAIRVGSAANASSGPALAVPAAVLAFASMAAVLMLQLLGKMPMFRGAPLLVLPAMLLASLVCLAGVKLRVADLTTHVLDAFAFAIVLALVLNFAIVVVERQGLHLYIYRFGFRPFSGRAEGLIGQPNQLAVFVTLAGAAANYLWMRGRLPTLLHVLLAVMSAFIVAATGSRAGLLLWLAGAAVAATALRGQPRRAVGWRLLFVGSALVLAAQLALPWMDAAGTGVAAARGESRGRIELWRDSLELIRLHPLFGVGYGNFMAARWTELSGSLLEPNANQAHNLIAQLASELGLLGATLVLVPLGWALWSCLRVVTRPGVAPEQYFAAAFALLIAGYAMVEFPLWYLFFLVPFALMLGLVKQPVRAVRVTPLPPSVKWLGWGVSAALCVLLAIDYDRSEELFTSIDLQQRENRGGLVHIPLQAAAGASSLSAFDVYTNLMYARTLSADGLFMGYKLDIADRAMLSMTNEETVGRKISFLLATHDDEAARQLLARTRRSPDFEERTRGVLQKLAPANPAIGTFVSGLPPLPAPRLGNNPPATAP